MQTRIVLVDEDALYREVMAADLEERGYAVVSFADGAAVQAGLEAEAMLIDWSLPQMSGLAVLRPLVDGVEALVVDDLRFAGRRAPVGPFVGDGSRGCFRDVVIQAGQTWRLPYAQLRPRPRIAMSVEAGFACRCLSTRLISSRNSAPSPRRAASQAAKASSISAWAAALKMTFAGLFSMPAGWPCGYSPAGVVAASRQQ